MPAGGQRSIPPKLYVTAASSASCGGSSRAPGKVGAGPAALVSTRNALFLCGKKHWLKLCGGSVCWPQAAARLRSPSQPHDGNELRVVTNLAAGMCSAALLRPEGCGPQPCTGKMECRLWVERPWGPSRGAASPPNRRENQYLQYRWMSHQFTQKHDLV